MTSAGRQLPLARAFGEAPGCNRLLVADHDPLAVGRAAAVRFFLAPAFDGKDYGPWLLELCQGEAVGCIVSLSADEQLVLQGLRAELEAAGVQLLGMAPENLDRCLDKRRLAELTAGTGFSTPQTWTLWDWDTIPDAAFPVVIKPAFGRGSRGHAQAAVRAELASYARAWSPGEYVVQPLLEGTEFGMDLVNDLEGQPKATLQRKKLRMRDGETEIATTVRDARLHEAGIQLAGRLAHSGVVDVDVIQCGEDLFVLDVNPRFGGGYIFNHHAGANIPAAIVAWLAEEAVEPGWLQYQAGLTFARTSTLQSLEQLSDCSPGPGLEKVEREHD
jgi:carbamoyl-phosphate synthase large subunit